MRLVKLFSTVDQFKQQLNVEGAVRLNGDLLRKYQR